MSQASCKFSSSKFNSKTASLDVENDDIPLLQGSKRTPTRGFRRDMTNHQTASRPTKAAIGEQCHRLAQASANDSTGNPQHLAHAWPTSRPFVANDHDISGLDLAKRHRAHGIFLAIKDSGRPPVIESLMTSNLDHTSLRRKIPFEDN